MKKFFDFRRSEFLMLIEAIIHHRRFRRLKIRDKQFEVILNHLKNHNYMIFNRMDKFILLAALKHWHFKRQVIEEPKTKYITRKTYKNLVERFEKELKE